MHVLLLNWRDLRHPRKGGAEVLTHGVFSGLVERGHRVTWVTSAFPGAKAEEEIDGIRILRGGNAVSVRAHAYAQYRKIAHDVDVVVDEINTLPFFTPLYSRAPVVAFICQLAREVWFYESAPGVSTVGYAIEPFYLRPYRSVPTMTISESSARSLRTEAGFTGRIGIMPMAIDQYEPENPLPLHDRDDAIVTLGRVTPSKRLDQSIRALALLPERFKNMTLRIIGGGSDEVRTSLDALARELGVGERVQWTGFASEDDKRRMLARSKALVMTSVREGWGLAVTEANLAGTPAVGYDTWGLQDSIKSGKTGIVTEESPAALANALTELLSDDVTFAHYATSAQADAKTLTWEATRTFTEAFLHEIAEYH